MIDYVKKHKWYLIVGGILLTFGVPFVLHCLFKIYPSNKFFAAEWSAGEFLTYYGSILSFLGTASLGILALWQNQIIEQKTIDYNKMLQQMETKKNMPKLRCVYKSSNGNFANIITHIENVSENIASRITATNLEVRDEQNAIVKTSTLAKLDKDTLCGGEHTILSFTNEPLCGNNLNVSFRFTCIDKYESIHYYEVFGITEPKESNIKLKTIEMEEL